ncbi:MAG: hypothetical protein IKN35_02540, partial [Lachnospiraceae bacterium]|nr:hypothetical protein [Lachnospiraceae bacterium]
MRKQIVCTLLIGAMLIGGCGNVKLSYGEAGMKDYDSAEDLENDLEARKVDGYHVTIAGDEYDLRSSGTELIGQMVKNDMAVVDTWNPKYYNEEGELSDIGTIGSKDKEGYNEEGYPEKYFDGKSVKNA